jgi:FixJ family two-component response regulator
MSRADAPRILGMLHKQMTSEFGTSETTVKVHREDGSEFYGSVPVAPFTRWNGKVTRPLVVRTGEVN